jgi:acyl-CoA hydrolase
VHVGAVVSCYCDVIEIGRSSMRIMVEVWINSPHDGEPIKVTEGEFVFVAIDEQRRTRTIKRLRREAPLGRPFYSGVDQPAHDIAAGIDVGLLGNLVIGANILEKLGKGGLHRAARGSSATSRAIASSLPRYSAASTSSGSAAASPRAALRSSRAGRGCCAP